MRRLALAVLSGTALAAALPVAAQQAPPAVAGRDGFQLRSEDGAFNLRLRGGIQTDFRGYLDDPAPAMDQFQARRIRTDFTGTLYRDFQFRIQLDFASARVDLLDAYLDAPVAAGLRFRVGKMKAPVGLERLQTPYTMTFAERAFPTLVLPNRETGAMLTGSWMGGVVQAAAGVFNGATSNGIDEAEPNDSKDLLGRVFVRPFARRTGAPDLGLGVAGTVGEQLGTPAAPLLTSYATSNGRSTFFRTRADATPAGTVIANGARTRISPQGHLYAGPVGILAEYAMVDQEVSLGTVADELDTRAWQAAASWVITGEKAAYAGVRPAQNYDRTAGTWGAFEVAARYEQLSVDEDAFPRLANPASAMQSASTATAGLNWYLNPAVRTSVNFSRTMFDAAAGGTARADENVIVTRFQVVF